MAPWSGLPTDTAQAGPHGFQGQREVRLSAPIGRVGGSVDDMADQLDVLGQGVVVELLGVGLGPETQGRRGGEVRPE